MPISLPDYLAAYPAPLVMGIVNVTPDSFSDGGRFLAPDAAIAQARQLIDEGADIIDIGAESTRPYGNAKPISAEDEIGRLQPVLRAIVALGRPVSIDTMKADVADWALAAGAAIANDVWGLQGDAAMARVVAGHDVPVVVMHNRREVDPAIDIVADMLAFFERSLEIAERAHIERRQILLDPGIGFGKTPAQSIEALGRLAELKSLGCPLLVGASRKRFIATLSPSEPDQRVGGSIAAHLASAARGAAIVRVHDVKPTVQALAVMRAIAAKSGPSPVGHSGAGS